MFGFSLRVKLEWVVRGVGWGWWTNNKKKNSLKSCSSSTSTHPQTPPVTCGIMSWGDSISGGKHGPNTFKSPHRAGQTQLLTNSHPDILPQPQTGGSLPAPQYHPCASTPNTFQCFLQPQSMLSQHTESGGSQ